jgi:hypothetical protein
MSKTALLGISGQKKISAHFPLPAKNASVTLKFMKIRKLGRPGIKLGMKKTIE